MKVKCSEFQSSKDPKRRFPSEMSLFINDNELSNEAEGDVENTIRRKLNKKLKTELDFFTFWFVD